MFRVGTQNAFGAGERIRPAASVHRFQIEDGLLLLSDNSVSDSNCLLALNATAAYLWDLIGAGRTGDHLASELSRAWAIPVSRAQADVQSVVAQWRRHGLLAADKSQQPSAVPRAVDWRHVPAPQWTAEWACTIRGVAIAFASEEQPIGNLRPLLEHLETPNARPQMRFEFRRAPDGQTALVRDGVERVRTRHAGLLLGCLWQTILEGLYPDRKWLALIHGAVIARNGMGIALCAPSGSGKTTLTAALTAGGFDYFADDLVALTAPDKTVLPWPLPLGVKSGSVNVLADHCPALRRTRTYRTKGTEAHLLVPPESRWYAEPVPLRTLVFPRFSQGAAPSLERISCLRALEHLLADRIWIGNPITADGVATLLDWLRETPGYACTYGSLADGLRLMKDLPQ